jgi:hypothetical protein
MEQIGRQKRFLVKMVLKKELQLFGRLKIATVPQTLHNECYTITIFAVIKNETL